MGPAYWKADGKHILDQVGYCYIHGYCMKPAQNSTRCNHSWQSQGHIDKATREDTMGGLSWGNPKILWKRGIVAKNIVNKFSKINLINNTTNCPHITLNRYVIEDSDITLHCYSKDTPMNNDCTASALHDVQPERYQIVSTLQADMKVSTLNNEARREYKFTTLTQNLL